MILLHRQILSALPGTVVDHINHDKLDNRKVNIRLCSQAENAHNTKGHKDSLSQEKGVCYQKGQVNKKWRATIFFKGKKYELGLFHKKEEAAVAYKEAAQKLHGEFLHYSLR